MRRIEFGRRREEASCGVPHELLNRGSQVRILSPASHTVAGTFRHYPPVRSTIWAAPA